MAANPKKTAKTDALPADAAKETPDDAVKQSTEIEKPEPTPPVDGKSRSKDPDPEPLFGLDDLAADFRVPGWQHAAVLRMTGWQPGKQVARSGYEKALADLANRRQGGGRR